MNIIYLFMCILIKIIFYCLEDDVPIYVLKKGKVIVDGVSELSCNM